MIPTMQLGQTGRGFGEASDPDFSSVSLLCHFDGANNSTTATDSSSYATNPTAGGGAKLTTALSYFGTACAVFDGSDDQFATSSYESRFAFANDYTIEGFVRFASASGAQLFFSLQQSSGSHIWLEINSNTAGKMSAYILGSYVTSINAINANQWYYVAVKRVGSTNSFWIDGVQQGTYTSSTAIGTSRVAIGGSNGLSQTWLYLNGYCDEWRITKGVGRNVSVIPSSPFPNA